MGEKESHLNLVIRQRVAYYEYLLGARKNRACLFPHAINPLIER